VVVLLLDRVRVRETDREIERGREGWKERERERERERGHRRETREKKRHEWNNRYGAVLRVKYTSVMVCANTPRILTRTQCPMCLCVCARVCAYKYINNKYIIHNIVCMNIN